MRIGFNLRFEPSEINEWAHKYQYPGEPLIEEIAARARQEGYLTRDQLSAIGRWKSPRIEGRCASNDDGFVRATTATALSSTNERLRIEVLTLLCGVEWPTASVILHFCSTDRYPILDF